MPKTAMDYSKCSIYKIEHIENESLVYVGHTTNWDKRKNAHKSNCKNENGKSFNLKLYQMIRGNGGWDCFKMIEVEKYPCKDKREAERRENEVMKELKANMNDRQSFLTEKERKDYYETNKDILLKKMKEYRDNNKDIINEYMKEYRETNKGILNEKKKQYYQNNKDILKEKTKQYRETNKEKIQEYRDDNREKIREYFKEKITCQCGCNVLKYNLKQHERTKKHSDLINPIQ